MTNPTSNFGWQMPTSTDLVTDLPADFETFGQAVDTSLADLKGGTSGQVLSKASNTDMDFTWVAQDDSNAIQNAIVDAKGDLIAASAADTPARLAIGNNGETLVADSSTSTGLRWQSPVQQNPVINSAMQVWQRGTSMAGSGTAFAADRWQAYRSVAGSTYSRQLTNDTTNLPFIQYATRVQRDSGNTATAGNYLLQNFESINSIPFAGKTVTLSWYARAGANFSAASSIMEYNLATGTGTDQNILTGFTGRANPILGNATLTTTWQRFTVSATLATNITQIGVAFDIIAWVGTAGANDWFEVTGVQLEVGSVATPFKTYAGTIQGELAACQRYYEKSYNVDVAPGTSTDNGQVVWAFVGTTITGTMLGYRAFSVIKRGAPTITLYDPVGNINKVRRTATGSANYDNISANVDGSYNNGIFINSASSASATNAMSGHWTASAEL